MKKCGAWEEQKKVQRNRLANLGDMQKRSKGLQGSNAFLLCLILNQNTCFSLFLREVFSTLNLDLNGSQHDGIQGRHSIGKGGKITKLEAAWRATAYTGEKKSQIDINSKALEGRWRSQGKKKVSVKRFLHWWFLVYLCF